MDEKQISELLECSVCLERLDQSCKVLPCQHTFCRKCLEEIILTKSELRCPECRALVTVRVSELPTNILVVRILEGLKTKCQRSSGGSFKQHGPGSLSSSPSKGLGSGLLGHDASSSHRQGTQPCSKALYNYDSSEKDDLTFRKGDMIVLRRKIDDNWFQGEIDGRIGYFPSNFVQVVVPLPQVPQCVALYDFELRDEGEKDCLSFKKDEILTVIRRVDENWLEGRKGDKIGIFPLTFVKLNEAARSLINTKSNLTIQIGLSGSPNTPVTSSGVIVSSAASSPAGTNRADASGTATAVSSIISPSSNCITAARGSSLSSDAITDTALLITNSADDQTKVLTLEATEDGLLPDSPAVVSGNSQHELGVATTLAQAVTSAPALAHEVLAQNKRHSFTSTSMSSPFVTAASSSDHTPQRHSVEVTLSEQGALALVSSEINLSLQSSSLPSSVVTETQSVTSQSPRNTPSSPVTTSEINIDASSSPSSSGSVQTGSLATPVYIALYNYKPRKDDELELHKGDLYGVVEKCQDGWYRGSCLRTSMAGVFPGNYVQIIRHSSAFKPVNPNMLNTRTKAPTFAQTIAASQSMAAGDQRPAHISGETSSQAPPLMPRVAKISTSGQIPRSPLSHLGGTPLRSLSSPGTCPAASASPKHLFSHSSSSSHAAPHTGLSRPLIPAPPPATTSSPHHSLWVPPSLATMQHSMSASSNVTPPNVVMSHSLDLAPSAGKEKKEKKEKEKKGLVKLLSGKSKKTKQTSADPEPVSSTSAVCFDGGIHSRSASYPVNGTAVGAAGDTTFISAHGKAASFDATTIPPIPAKPRPKLSVRERYCCIVPYPPQTEQELSLELGDIIHIHRKREDGWYKGTQERTGKTGMFPASFVEKCD